MLDMNILKSFPFVALPGLAYRLLLRKLHRSKYTDITRIEKAEIIGTGEITGHIDGEPVFFQQTIQIKVIPGSLKVITGDI